MLKLKKTVGKIKIGQSMIIDQNSTQKEIKKALVISPSIIHNFDKINLNKKENGKASTND